MQPFVVRRASQAMDNLQGSLNGTLDLVFVGDDDRIGFGFEQSSIPEAQSVYRFSAVAAMRAAAAAYQKGGDSATAAALSANATKLWDITRHHIPNDWYLSLGVHAAASALHSGVSINSQQRQVLVETLSNPTMLPSHSPFSTYFILRGLSAAGLGKEALDLVRREWFLLPNQTGAYCTWERYDWQWSGWMQHLDAPPNTLNQRTSLCHNWGAG